MFWSNSCYIISKIKQSSWTGWSRHSWLTRWCPQTCQSLCQALVSLSSFLSPCVWFLHQSQPSVKSTNSAACSWTAGRSPTPSASASWSWPSSGFDPATLADSCASRTAASVRSWPATMRLAPSCREPSEAANPGSPHPPWSSTYGRTSSETRGFLPGRSGTGYSPTGFVTSSTSRPSAPSAGSCATRSGICPSRVSTSPGSRRLTLRLSPPYPTTTCIRTRPPKCQLPLGCPLYPDTWPCTGYGLRRTLWQIFWGYGR